MNAKQIPINTLVFHMDAQKHIDDAACLWLAYNRPEAETRFPGISQAQIIFDGHGGEKYQGMSAEELEEKGVLMFGVGASRFDEHSGPDNAGKNHCSFALFCKEIGVYEDPALSMILSYVAEADLGNAGHHWAVASVAKIMNSMWPDDPLKIFNWQIEAIAAIYAEQVKFQKAIIEYREKAVEKEITGPWGRRITIAIIESDTEIMNNVARSQGANVVIQRRPTTCELLPGNVTISIDRKAKLGLQEVVAVIRQEEQRIRGSVVTTGISRLRAPGKIEGVLEWYYLTGKSEMLLNGSYSAPDVPATMIPLETITNIVIENIDRVQ